MALVAVGAGLVLASADAASGGPLHDCSSRDGAGANQQLAARHMVDLINQHRRSRHLATLAISESLTRSGLWKARHVARYGDFQHDDTAPPTHRSFQQRFRDCGYRYTQAGEILAGGADTAEFTLANELSQSPERGLIEGSKAHAIGVGAVLAGDGTPYWITEFGTTADGSHDPAPVARSDSAKTSTGHTVPIAVLANDSDREKQWLGIVDADDPQHGSIGISISRPSEILYTPDPGFTGKDHFRYKVANLVGLTATATVTVTVSH